MPRAKTRATPEQPEFDIRGFRRRLLTWFQTAARDLPWRRTRDPYAIWLSEVMLQQTQVATVIGYYARFLARFPTIESLASAPEDDVLRYWEGLGYYRRARQLHRAACVIVAEHAGRFPDDPAAVRRLPGIGRYTAGAILSIAFDRAEPILEANTVRLLARLLAYRDDPTTTAGQRVLWDFSARLVPVAKPGIFNQALMELGATICTPRNPECARCPVMSLCPTRAGGWQATIPATPKPRAVTRVEASAIVVRRASRVLLVKRASGRWAGLWDFPRFEHDSSAITDDELAAEIAAATGLRVVLGSQLARLEHSVTRWRIALVCRWAVVAAGRLKPTGDDTWQWSRISELSDLPLNVTGRKIARLIVSASD